MKTYSLEFISDSNLHQIVGDAVSKFRKTVDLKMFLKNLPDPVKMTFEQHVYKKSEADVIQAEVARQIGKTIENAVGSFHQRIFSCIKGWSVPDSGFDIQNDQMTVLAELKNKFNTMNSSSAQSVYNKFVGAVTANLKVTAYLVEVIAKGSQDVEWTVAGQRPTPQKAKRIRKISIDKFYEIATGDANAFCKLCSVLGVVIDDVLKESADEPFSCTVLEEMQKKHGKDLIKSVFLSAFSGYQGFEKFAIKA